MLREIPVIITPELMKAMMEMGHSDTLILADANFPAATNAKKLIRAEGVEIPELLEAILRYFPLDNYVQHPVSLMKPLEHEPVPEIWAEYESIIRKYDKEKAFSEFKYIERLDFYKEAQNAYIIVQTGTTARYANIILQKGVV